MNTNFITMRTSKAKYLGLFLTLIGLIIIFLSKSPSAEIPLLVGLFALFVVKEREEDERAKAVRSSSALTALIIGYGLKLLLTNLHEHGLIGIQLTSINYFLIIVFSIANLIYYSRLYIFLR